MSKPQNFWRHFIGHFLLAALPVWLVVAAALHYFDPAVRTNILILVASLPAFIAGILSGIWRSNARAR